jgi:hypothetical protein
VREGRLSAPRTTRRPGSCDTVTAQPTWRAASRRAASWRWLCLGLGLLGLPLLGTACKKVPAAPDAGHVDFDLAHGLPVLPGARVVYGGTQDDVFTLELATARPVASVAAWYRRSLPRVGWRGLEITGPGRAGSMRLRATRGVSWLLGRIRSDGYETEVTFAKGTGPEPAPAQVLPDEASAAASQAASAPAGARRDGGAARRGGDGGPAADAHAISASDILETLLLPDSVRRVGMPTAHGHVAMAGISADLSPTSATAEVAKALAEGGWRIDAQRDGVMPGTRELVAVHGDRALRLTLFPSGRGANGTVTVGPATDPEIIGAPRGGRPPGRHRGRRK